MKINIKISIITCTLNSAIFLKESIQSVLSQNHEPIEYIFVDGGSIDGTLEMIRAIPGKVKLIEGVRGGIARAMNAGIDVATGDVIAHLHSDDYYANSDVLSKVAQALSNSEADWVFGRCMSDNEGVRLPEGYVIPRFSHRRLLKSNFIPHPATFIRRRLFERVGRFDPDIKYAMDYDLWLRLAAFSNPVQLDEHLAVFRWHAGSLTSSNRLASFDDDFVVRMRYAPHTPWSYVYHWAHYLVRRNRLIRALERGAA